MIHSLLSTQKSNLPCIEFGPNRLKFCEVSREKGRLLIRHLAVFETVQGQLDKLGTQLKSYLLERKISLRECSLLLPTHLAAIRFLRLPSKDPKEIEGMVGWQAAKQLPYSSEEIIHSYHIINTEESGFSNVILFITHKDTTAGYLKVLSEIGARPVVLSLSCEGLKLLYTFQTMGDSVRERENTALVEIAEGLVSVCVVQKQTLSFVRGVSIHESASFVERALSEIMRSFDTYRDLEFSQKIDRIVVSGPEEFVSEIIETLKGRVSAPVEKIDYRRGLDFAEGQAPLTVKKNYSFASVIGAALGRADMKINLLPREIIGELSFYHTRQEFTKTLLLALGVVVLAIFICAKKIYDKNSFLNFLNRELSALGEDTVKLDEKARRLELISRQIQKRSHLLASISELYRATPPGITFSNVLYEQDKGLTIRGEAGDMSLVFKFVSTLEASDSFSGVQVGYVTKRTTPSGGTIDFEINAPLEGTR